MADDRDASPKNGRKPMKKSQRVVLLTLGGLFLYGCTQVFSPDNVQGDRAFLNDGDEGCWPIQAGVCEDRALTTAEMSAAQSRINNMPTNTNTCIENKARLQSALDAGRIRVWTVGTPEYHPDSAYGDAHVLPQVIHVTANALANSYAEYDATLRHEGMHNRQL
jgi:hypothetical protein